MNFITADTRQINSVEVINFGDKKWLNGKHIEEQLGHSALRNITLQYLLYLGKQRQELQNCDKQPCRRFLREDFAVQIIMDCRTIIAVNFKTRLGFKQHDPMMTKEIEKELNCKFIRINPAKKILIFLIKLAG